MVAKITFSYFSTEKCCDFVSIYDGFNSSSNTIAYISGLDVNHNDLIFTSTQQYMYIKFTSNGLVTYQGFSATFESIREELHCCTVLTVVYT